MTTTLKTMFAVFLLLAVGPGLHAATLFFSGDLRTDGTGCPLSCSVDSDYAQYAAVIDAFTVSTASTMHAVTFGFGGGTSGTGAIAVPGGFEPYLSLFDSSGSFMTSTFDPATTCPVGANTFNGNCFDVRLDSGVLAPGTYSIAITAYENMSYAENLGDPSLKLSDGFTGLGNLAAGENLNYAFDVVLDSTTQAPEPGTAVLLVIASALFGIGKFRYGRRTTGRSHQSQ
jgi:hypothetical protein